MAKMITQTELAEIITKLLTPKSEEIDDVNVFCDMMADIAGVVTKYCGGEVLNRASGESGVYMVGIHANECLPPDGGVWKDYDTDVTFLNGEEVDAEVMPPKP